MTTYTDSTPYDNEIEVTRRLHRPDERPEIEWEALSTLTTKRAGYRQAKAEGVLLLKALRTILKATTRHYEHGDVWQIVVAIRQLAEAAIAQAEGRE